MGSWLRACGHRVVGVVVCVLVVGGVWSWCVVLVCGSAASCC